VNKIRATDVLFCGTCTVFLYNKHISNSSQSHGCANSSKRFVDEALTT
jgi:hypothetical protein